MKKALIKVLAIMFSFVILSLPVYSDFSAAAPQKHQAASSEKVMESRFLNMLNHNYVYNDSFDDLEDIVNDSVIALLDMRDEEDSQYISQDVVNSYLYDMYGFTVDDFSDINKDFPQKDGYVFILPRGFSRYEHRALDIRTNSDGTYTFTTEVSVISHDGVMFTATAETVFVKNPNSAFGYNIVSSDFSEGYAYI